MALLLGFGLGALGGCAGVPNVEPVMAQSANTDAKPELAGARGPLNAEQSKVVLDKLRAQAPDSDVLQRHLAIEEAIAESPLVIGNRTRILRDGAATFSAMFAAIQYQGGLPTEGHCSDMSSADPGWRSGPTWPCSPTRSSA
jgi:cardiolipin synthase A/B